MKNLTIKNFIEKSRAVHSNIYDYSRSEYVNSSTKLEIICLNHGSFMQTPNKHISAKQGCPVCRYLKSAKNSALTNDEFVKRANQVHGNKYDYSKVIYKNSQTKVCIICSDHGEFWQTPPGHLSGKGCRLCGYVSNGLIFTKSIYDFIAEAKRVHGNKYDYSKVEYIHCESKVIILCSRHGEFWQAPSNHLKGAGCPMCRSSRGENKIRFFFKNKNILLEEQKTFDDCKNKIRLRFDFYLPEYNTLIEFDGIQHFKPHSFSSDQSIETKKKNLEIVKQRDMIKDKYCCSNNIQLLRIRYNQFKSIENILQKELYKHDKFNKNSS